MTISLACPWSRWLSPRHFPRSQIEPFIFSSRGLPGEIQFHIVPNQVLPLFAAVEALLGPYYRFEHVGGSVVLK
jgi:hypothetical protein